MNCDAGRHGQLSYPAPRITILARPAGHQPADGVIDQAGARSPRRTWPQPLPQTVPCGALHGAQQDHELVTTDAETIWCGGGIATGHRADSRRACDIPAEGGCRLSAPRPPAGPRSKERGPSSHDRTKLGPNPFPATGGMWTAASRDVPHRTTETQPGVPLSCVRCASRVRCGRRDHLRCNVS